MLDDSEAEHPAGAGGDHAKAHAGFGPLTYDGLENITRLYIIYIILYISLTL